MPVPVIMPKVDMDQEIATIISWSKLEGDLVKIEETLLIVETEKVAIDVPSPATGQLVGILYQAGAVVPVATEIAYILKEGETLESIPSQQISDTVLDSVKQEKEERTRIPGVSPLAIKVANELGVCLEEIPSDGKRITKSDVEAYAMSKTPKKPNIDQLKTDKVAATPAARRTASNYGIDLTTVTGSGPRGRIQVADILNMNNKIDPISKLEMSYDVVPFIGMRQKIAKKLQSSFQEAPHFSMTIDCDMSLIESMRQSYNDKYKDVKVTLTAMIVWVTSWALVQNKLLNSSIAGDEIRVWDQVNIGVAIAIDAGLIVPVIHCADTLDIIDLADRINRLGKKAREGMLEISDVQNGTFTISNLGMFGIPNFQAVINPPEACILGAGAVIRKPMVLKDSDQIVIRPMMNVTISADHRILDGAVVAKFLNDLKTGLENPFQLLA